METADVCPLLHCSGPAAGLHLQLQQAPLPHLLLLRSQHGAPPQATARSAAEKGQNTWGNIFALHQGSLVALFMVTGAYFSPVFLTSEDAKPLQTPQLAGFCVWRPGIGLPFV